MIAVLACFVFWVWVGDTSGSEASTPNKVSYFILRWGATILVGTAAVWVVWTQVIPYVAETFGPNNGWVQAQPEVTVVNNGFHRHDAKFPKIIEPDAFHKTVQPDRVYNAFEVKPGDVFQLKFYRPIWYKIKGEQRTVWTLCKTPGKFRATTSGMIQIKSETGGNDVRVAPST